MTKTATTPPVMSPQWCASLQRAAHTVVAFAKCDDSEAATTASGILSAASGVANQPTQQAHKRAWTGDAALRVWGRACDDLRGLMAPDDERARVLRSKELAILARQPMRLLEAVARLYAELAPALLDNATGDDRIGVIASIQVQEFLLNYVITPAVIDAHQKLARIRDDVRPGQVALVTHEAELFIVDRVACFAQVLCKLAEQHAPGSNP